MAGGAIRRGIRKLLGLSLPPTTLIIEKDEIEKRIFHRGRALFLDRVVFLDGKVIGEFLVTEAACEGHSPMPGKLVMKGPDLADMAAQLLGVWAYQVEELRGCIGMLRDFGGRIRGFIVPGEKVVMTLNVSKESEDFTVEESAAGAYLVSGNNFSIRVGDESRGRINLLTFTAFRPKTPAPTQEAPEGAQTST